MRNRKIAMTLAIILTVAMIASGCGGAKPAENSKPTTATGTETTDGRAMEGNMYVEGLPIVKEQETFSLLVDGSTSEDPQTLEIVKMLQEQTNVKVDWMVYPYEVATEKRNILLNSGNYPDAIGGWLVGVYEVVKYGQNEKVFIPLEDLFKKYAPNVEKVLNLENIRRDMTLPNGHIYSPPYVCEGSPEVTEMQWINQKWLDNLKLKMPTTTDELYEVLKAFKEKDANGNGDPNDEIPFSSQHDRSHNWFPYFGASVYDSHFLLIDGKVTYTGNSDFYKDGINYYAKLYKEGLIDPEIFTQDSNNYTSKGKAKDAVYGVFNGYSPNTMSPGLDSNGLNIRCDEYVPLPPLTSAKCSNPIVNRSSNGTSLYASQIVITDKAKNPNTIVRWLNNVYEAENSLQMGYGRFGVTLEKKDDGTYRKMETTDITGAPGYSQWIGTLPKYVPKELMDKVECSPADKASAAKLDDMSATWKGKTSQMLPMLWMSDEQNAKVSNIGPDLNNFAREKRAQWITGVADVNKEWDSYKAQLDKLGLQTFIKVYTDAYNEKLKMK